MVQHRVRLNHEEGIRIQGGHIPYSSSLYWASALEEFLPVVEVFMSQKAYRRCCNHAATDLEREVGGWLVGKLRKDFRTGRNYVIVENVLPAPHVEHGRAYLTFTQDTQVALFGEMEERYPGSVLVGWYHTHPGMGVFFSEYDSWLHQHFFPEDWQVALVIEPVNGMGGFFIRQGHLLDRKAYYGFFELTNGRSSVVRWNNLLRRPLDEDSEEVLFG